ncbi:MAG: efflux RND transporter periplasmic adaptor subunit [Treponema sp.]|nr:efflux RND transporter periplasmic adaptor subunit [Treponema sp.]
MKLQIYLTIVFFPVFFISCLEQNDPQTVRQVRGVAAQSGEISDEAGGFGTLSYITKLDITASQEGLVTRLFYREGDFVRQGETVIFLENPHVILALERAENNYSQARAAVDLARSRLLEGEFQAEAQLLSIEKTEAELDRFIKQWEEDERRHQNQQIMFSAGGINEETIRVGRFNLESEWDQILIMQRELEIRKIGCRDADLVAAGIPVPQNENAKRRALVELMTAGLRAELGSANAGYGAADKELRSARIARDDLVIKSQTSGVIGARYFEEGERVKSGDKILTLMDTSSLYAIFPMREKDALRIEKGMEARVQIDGIGGGRNGTVDLVYPQADSQSMSFVVRVLIEGDPGDLKPGMFCRVQVILGPPRRVVFLPASALAAKRNNEAEIFVINGDTLSGRKVILGRVQGDLWEINSGIRAGEIAVLRPDSDMREGTFVSLAE